ncbi:multidrug effflux MFS transporter [Fodinicola acaciae]|uniref:multidrug effflux MFS transporter n=1 Tax=Fodinicola acaciae TaxID=2681555 RepID=UPI0013D6C81B|nr:multidrug effflux MFS transporter [Fodinicola acaciae]
MSSVETGRPRVGLVLLLGAITILGPLSIDLYLPAFPTIEHELGASEAAVQLTLTGFLVGLALGQPISGPLSDAIGRRRPMLIGLSVFVAMSVVLAVAPNIEILIGARFLQGVAGAFGVAVAMGMVRDLAAGAAAARLLSTMMLVTGLGPILAPMVGGQLLRFVDWRGMFWFLALVAAGLLATAYFAIPETLTAERRTVGGVRAALRSYRTLVTDRVYVGYALTNGLMFGAVFGYVAAASFVYQGIYHMTPQQYGIVAGVNALGMVAMTQLNGRLVSFFHPRRLLITGLVSAATWGVLLLAIAFTRPASVWWIAVPLFLMVASIGLVMPNGMAMALNDYPKAAGTGAALIGANQFVLGGAVTALMGLGGSATAIPMAGFIAALTLLSLTVQLVLARPRTPAATAARQRTLASRDANLESAAEVA